MAAMEMVAAMKAEAESVVAKYTALELEIVKDMKASEDKGFDEGLKQAGIPASDKIYSEADLATEKALAAAAATAAAELAAQPKLEAAVADITAQIIAEVENTQIDNNAVIAKYKKA